MDINHIHLAVKDLQNSMSFYSQNFGFQHRINHGKIVFLTNADGFDYDDFVFFRCTDPDGYALEVYWE